MADPRCPNCSARVPADADWCSLCYASLRVQPAPAPAPRHAAPVYAPSAPSAPSAYDPLFSPIATLSDLAAPEAEPAAAAAPREATWPCRLCAAAVPIEFAACGVCGASFLGTGDVELRLPLVGSVKDLTGTRKLWIMIGGSVGIIAAFLLVAFLIGLVA
jgi:hypothetical protein